MPFLNGRFFLYSYFDLLWKKRGAKSVIFAFLLFAAASSTFTNMGFGEFLCMALMLMVIRSTVSQTTSYCSKFSATKTSSAAAHYCSCHVTMCPGDTLYADGCSKCSGYQFFRLYNSAGVQLTTSEAYSSTCYPCGEIRYFQPSISQCEKFTLRQGCYLQNTCSGKVRLRVYNSTTGWNASSTFVLLRNNVEVPLHQPNQDDEEHTSRILRRTGTTSSSSSSSSGYCNRDDGITVGGIIAAIMVPLFCCGFCITLVYHLFSRQHGGEKVVPTGGEFMMVPNNFYTNGNVAVAVPAQYQQHFSPATQPAMFNTAPLPPQAAVYAAGTPVAVPVY